MNFEEFKINAHFKPMSERLSGEAAQRIEESKNMLEFGVPFLDATLRGIAKNDVVVLGGASASGKTELVNLIAQHNILNKRRVHVFSLEAEPKEFERRIKFRLLSDRFFNDPDRRYANANINYADWRYGRLENELSRYYESVDREIIESFSTGYTCYRDRDFSMTDLRKAIYSVQASTDLVILDHLHYIDHDEDSDEYQAQGAIVKELRDMALDMGKPVVVVSHVRKVDKRTSPLIPSLQDFMGSSNIAKIATKAIMLSPAHLELPPNRKHCFGTFMLTAKNRPDGSTMRYLGLSLFNFKTARYDQEFKISKYYDGIQEFQEITNAEEKPHWAKTGLGSFADDPSRLVGK
jgi:replicative DNA helicase